MTASLLEQLIEALRVLPGVGQKSAQRMAYHVLERNREGGKRLAYALAAAVERIGQCSDCRDFSESEVCAICASNSRDAHLLCVVETPADLPDMAPNELSFYAFENMWQKNCVLRRYALRKDGLISYRAPLVGATLLTKPLICTGDRLMLNFATSAVGHIYVSILDETGAEIPGYRSHEVFGDNLDRPVVFAGGPDVSALAGRPIRLKFTLRDADLYAFQFVAADFQ